MFSYADYMSENEKSGYGHVHQKLIRAFEVHVLNNKTNVVFKSKIKADILAIFSNTIVNSVPGMFEMGQLHERPL